MIAPVETISQQPETPEAKSPVKTGVRLLIATYTLFAIAMAVASMLAVYSSIFFTLGWVLGTFPIAIALSLPVISLIESRKEIFAFSIVLGLSLIIPMLLARPDLFLPALQIFLLNTSIIALLLSVARLLLCWMDKSFALSILLLASAIWIAFPVWGWHLMQAHASDRWLAWTLNVHPVIAINSAYLTLGEWAHERVSYWWLTNLGQDVSYSFPFGQASASILFHFILAMLLIAIPIKPRPRV